MIVDEIVEFRNNFQKWYVLEKLYMYLLLRINYYILSQINRHFLINKLNFLFVSSSLVLIIITDYKVYDGFYTPLRGLYFLFYDFQNLVNLSNLSEFVESVIHNDSIKAFPLILEYIFSFGFRYWNPRMSLFLGFLSWILCYGLFLRIIIRLFELNKLHKQIISLSISLCFFSSLFFYTRFSILFAIHRTLPIICALFLSLLLFKNNKNYIFNNLDILISILLCIIAQFSFASGIFLWPNTFFALIFKRFLYKNSISKLKIYTFLFFLVLFSIIYFYLFDNSHIINLINNQIFEGNKLEARISMDLSKYLIFIFTYGSSFFNSLINFQNNYYLLCSIILFILYMILFITAVKNKFYIFSKDFLFKISPLIFLVSFNLFIIFSVFFSRGAPSIGHESRYFCESTIFSLSLIGIAFYLLLKLKRPKLLKICIVLALFLSINNLIAYSIYFKNYFLFPKFRSYTGESKLVECIKNDANPSLFVLENKCNLGFYFRYFQAEGKDIHPSIKIKDRDAYSEKIFKTFGNKKQYIYSQK